MKLISRFLLSCVLATPLLTTAGCSPFADAKLSEMTPGMSDMMDKLECWLTIEFKKYPDNVDLREVKVVFTSVALFAPETFDWNYIAAHDQIAQGLGKGYRPNEESRPEQNPPLRIKIKVNYPLKARPRIELDPNETITLKAELFWGGKKQGSISRTIEHVYDRTRG